MKRRHSTAQLVLAALSLLAVLAIFATVLSTLKLNRQVDYEFIQEDAITATTT